MPGSPRDARSPFQYAVLRVVPDIERGETVNAGIILSCRPRRYLAARVGLDRGLLERLSPNGDATIVEAHLDAIRRIAAGDLTAGPMAALSPSERFHWLVAPSSTVVQPGEVHTGLTDDPSSTLEHLFLRLVERPRRD